MLSIHQTKKKESFELLFLILWKKAFIYFSFLVILLKDVFQVILIFLKLKYS